MKQFAAMALALAAACMPAPVMAQFDGMAPGKPIEGPVHAPQGAVAIPLYGKATPGRPSDEIESKFMGQETVVRNITYPTLTPVLPDPEKANGTAVIVAPGGGFMMLAMQNEGWRIAQKLADHGIAAFVLKYRLNPTPKDNSEWLQALGRMFSGARGGQAERPEIKDSGATDDALTALKLVRSRASEFHVDRDRVGMIGFSAGAMATLGAVLRAPSDSDPETLAPDFIGFIYGPMKAVEVPAEAPPMFAALAIDDPIFGNGDFSIVTAWHAAKRPVELHVYGAGSHGFGLGRPGTTTTLMMDEFLAWMDMQGLLKTGDKQ